MSENIYTVERFPVNNEKDVKNHPVMAGYAAPHFQRKRIFFSDGFAQQKNLRNITRQNEDSGVIFLCDTP